MNYPDMLIRGMSNREQCISEEGLVLPGAFQFDKFDPEQNPEYCELSINWCDDDGAIEVAKKQINARTGQLQFQAGLARLNRKMLDINMKTYFDLEILQYERKPIAEDKDNNIAENKYHGNLLLKNSASKGIKKLVPNALAAMVGCDII